MKTKSKYIVAFTGLQNEVHSFTYNLDDAFFNEREYSPIRKGNVDVELEFEKNERFFVLNFRYAGTVEVECDRCAADDVTIPINNGASLLVKISDEEPEDLMDDEVMYISPTDIEIDYSQFLYENIVVDIPLYKTCEDDISGTKECDPNVLAILENEETESGEGETDPRWEKLKLLKLKNNGTSEE